MTKYSLLIWVTGNDPTGRPMGRIVAPQFPLQGMPDQDDATSPGSEAPPYRLIGDGRYQLSSRTYVLHPAELQPWVVDHERQPFLGLGIAPAEPPPMPFLAPGDILHARHAGFRFADRNDSEANLVTAGCRVIGSSKQESELVDILDRTDDRIIGRGSEVMDHEASVVSEALERARGQPHEALVLVWRPDHSRACGHILGSTGTWFFHGPSPDAEENGITINGPGIFKFSNGKPWSTSNIQWDDYDCGIDGDLVPATAKDLAAFGYDVASLRREIVDVMDDDLPEGADPIDWLCSQGAERPDWAGPREAATATSP